MTGVASPALVATNRLPPSKRKPLITRDGKADAPVPLMSTRLLTVRSAKPMAHKPSVVPTYRFTVSTAKALTRTSLNGSAAKPLTEPQALLSFCTRKPLPPMNTTPGATARLFTRVSLVKGTDPKICHAGASTGLEGTKSLAT